MKPLPVVYEPQTLHYLDGQAPEWREITGHLAPPHLPPEPVVARTLNDDLGVYAIDERGPGGASHLYLVGWRRPDGAVDLRSVVRFQKGGVKEAGVNGVSNEALLAIVADRLRCFQAGDFGCKENGNALACVYQALDYLHARTKKRVARGVEGRQIA